jgi:DNA-binding XRE family transcriptional regulator
MSTPGKCDMCGYEGGDVDHAPASEALFNLMCPSCVKERKPTGSMNNSTTAAEQCRLATGLTLAEAARRVGVSRQALYDWHRDSPVKFAAALKEAKDA